MLAALLRGSVGTVCECLGASPSADGFRSFLAHHQLLGYCAFLLDRHPQRCDLPPSLLADLDTHSRKLAWKNERVLATLPEICGAFERGGVPFILLKGLYFALRLYGGVERRTFWDMDLLVHPEHLQSARQLLADQGYRQVSPVFFNERVSRYLTHAYDFRKEQAPDIDLHWKLASHPGLRLDYDAVWESRQALAWAGTSLFTLSDDYALTFLLIGIVKDLERGALRLRSMVDLYKLLQVMDPEMDWPLFFAHRKDEGVERLCLEVMRAFFSLLQIHPAELPRLQETVRARTGDLPEQREVMAMLEPQRFAFHNKRWASRLYATSRLGYAWWWALSLPARLVVYRPARKSQNRKRRATG